MKYSVIIAVYNRLEEVQELLKSAELLHFDRQAFELLFVDDGSNDGFKNFIETYVSSSELNFRAIYQENKGPGAARNFGMQSSQADYFIFVDSDCLFPSNWLLEIDNFLAHTPLDAFGGPDGAHEDFSDLVKAINYSMTSFIGTGGTRGNKKSVAKFYPRSFNMGISKKVFQTIGGMNQLRHGQDMDFSARIYEAGFQVGLIPNALIYHKRRTSLKKFFKQIFNWGVARINLSSLHENMLKPIHLFPAFIVLGYGALFVLSLFSHFFSILLQGLISLHFILTLFAFFQSFSQYKKVKVAFLSMVTLNIQIFAYGLGLIFALYQKITGKSEVKGFVKNYYGKK